MKLEDQCCSLELAKKLKELGVPQESYFSWFDTKKYGAIIKTSDFSFDLDEYLSVKKIGSAFTSAELGQLLPNTVDIKKDEPFNFFRLAITKFISIDKEMNHINNFIVNYDCDTIEFSVPFKKLTKNVYDPNLANAMAKMLVYLIENNLMLNKVTCASKAS